MSTCETIRMAGHLAHIQSRLKLNATLAKKKKRKYESQQPSTMAANCNIFFILHMLLLSNQCSQPAALTFSQTWGVLWFLVKKEMPVSLSGLERHFLIYSLPSLLVSPKALDLLKTKYVILYFCINMSGFSVFTFADNFFDLEAEEIKMIPWIKSWLVHKYIMERNTTYDRGRQALEIKCIYENML